MPYSRICCIYYRLKYSSPNRSKNKTKQNKSHKYSIPFGKWRFQKKKIRRMGQKQERIKQKERQHYGQKNKRGDIEKWKQTGSPEIPDRGETSESPQAASVYGDVVAQLVERRPRNPMDSMTRGSNPVWSIRTICESFSESKC